ncbi:hypothetical protein [Sulfolobus polyhedral virus 3]|nr:hypothetical protein [Sulfolobus polyhedral virus 3]
MGRKHYVKNATYLCGVLRVFRRVKRCNPVFK